MPYDTGTNTHYVDRSKDKGHPRDCNAIARKLSESRSGPPSPEFESGYDAIKWNSKGN